MTWTSRLSFALKCFGQWNRSLLIPYKHSKSGLAEGLQRPATLWRPATSQPLGGTELGYKMDFWGLASSGTTSLSPDPSLCVLMFCFISSVLHQPIWCLHTCLLQRNRVSFQPSTTWWLQDADWLCAEPFIYTRSSLERHWMWIDAHLDHDPSRREAYSINLRNVCRVEPI